MNHSEPRHIVFSGGGTGGHLFPGLAVAERLLEHDPRYRITLAGGGKPLERQAVADAGHDYLCLGCRPFPSGPGGVLRFVLANVAGCRAARRFLRREHVSAVVGLGGYASVPMARAAVQNRTALLLLEQNALPGRVTRWLARHARITCTAFSQTRSHLPRSATVRLTGNPIRQGFVSSSLRPSRTWGPGSPRQLAVLGGSQGARALNRNVPQALATVRPAMAGWQIVHVAGQSESTATRQNYARLGLDARVVAFVQDMPELLARTDLAISRAGGTTLAELAALGVPAVLVPYPYAARDHQQVNAQTFASSGAAVTVGQRQMDGQFIAQMARTIQELVVSHARLAAMSRAMAHLARPDAASQVAMLLKQLAVSSDAGSAAGVRPVPEMLPH